MRNITAILLWLLVISAVPVSADAGNYFIGSGDILEISVWKDEALSRQIVVPPDEIISFPLIGDIDVKGMSITDLRNAVKVKISEFVPDATISVILMQINSLKAYVIGKVNNPGEFPISMDTSVMQMLAKAGGLNPFASPGGIHVLRRVKNDTISVPFNYKDVVKGEELKQNITLNRGDVIVVP